MGLRDWHPKKMGIPHKKVGIPHKKKITIFLSFLQKLREWHTKTKNYWDSRNFMQTHKKTHKNFLILKINILNKKNILVKYYNIIET